MTKRYTYVLLLASLLFFQISNAQVFQRISKSGSSVPRNAIQIGSQIVFVATDGINGLELWKSDGTESGTIQLKDINPGSGHSDPSQLTSSNGVIFFTANDPTNGGELWKTDGTPAGTVLVKDINPGGVSSNLSELTDVNGTLFFRAFDPVNGYNIWKSDGTNAGTVMVKDINPGTGSSGSFFLSNINGTLYFQATEGISGDELWKSDGTPGGTVRVKDINPGPAGSNVHQIINFNGKAVFIASNGINGEELWISDGTDVGTMMIKDINSGSAASSAGLPYYLNGTLYFSANDGVHGGELWKTDGTTAGTQLVQDIYSGTGGSAPGNFASINGTLIFSASTGTTQPEVFRSDGTDAGTMMVKDIGPGSFGAHPLGFIPFNGLLYFQAYDVVHGFEVWKTDGTDAGTSLLKDLDPGTEGFSLFPEKFAVLNNVLYFTNYNTTNNTVELWKSNGTTAGTEFIKIISSVATAVQPTFLLPVTNQLFFNGYDTGTGNELWRSDGTAAGTNIVKDINSVPIDYRPSNLADLNGTLFFSGFDQSNQELWTSDGTNAGTHIFKDIVVGGGSGSNPRNFVRSGSLLYFLGDPGAPFWPQVGRTDGTPAGTFFLNPMLVDPRIDNPRIGNLTDVNGSLFLTGSGTAGMELYKTTGTSYTLVKDINPNIIGGIAMGSDPAALTNVNGTLFFAADNGTNGRELWKSNGTDAGTVMVKDIDPTGSSNLDIMANINGTLFFVANDGVHGAELWKSDGTDAGTVMLKDINPFGDGIASGTLTSIVNVNGIAFFPGNDGPAHQTELWKSDGTPAGTVLVKDIDPLNPSLPQNLVVMNGILYFTAVNNVTDRELWRSDGTAAGTYLVKDINPGPSASNPSNLTVIDNRIYFSANDGTNGVELWKTDGTTAGTVLVQDFNPGSASSNVNNITQSGSDIFVVALDNSGFNQLYVAAIPADAPLPVHLLTFSARLNDKDGILDWKTSSEVNTSSFEIERSLDARTFSRVGARMAAGNTSSFTQYNFTDPNITLLNSKAVYYRLKMVDQDGSFSYSSIVVLNISSKNAVVVLYPNPAHNFLTMMISTRQREKIQYSIVDATGRIVRTGTQALQSGSNNVNIPLTELSSGVYTMVIEGSNGKVQHSFVKK